MNSEDSFFYFKYSADFMSRNPLDLYKHHLNDLIGGPEGTVFYMMMELINAGLDCQWGCEWPYKKIVISHPISLKFSDLPHIRHNYLVSWQMDFPRCLFAHEHIVMNSYMVSAKLPLSDRILTKKTRRILHFIPQPGLIPRSPERKDSFVNIGYMGESKNLLPELNSDDWRNRLSSIGLNFIICDDPKLMSNYEELDCIIAVRPSNQNIMTKPPTKLWNAWRAGVPAILSSEPGYDDCRKSEFDFICGCSDRLYSFCYYKK